MRHQPIRMIPGLEGTEPMDPTKNSIPPEIEQIHLIAVCGTGMGALACMLKDLGYGVTGSDQKIYPPMSDFLEQKGVAVSDGFCEKNIAYGPDLVIVGNAVTRENPEAKEMHKRGLNFCSMPQAINRFVASGKHTILVTGTHGKTTTASLAAWMLYKGGYDPSFFIGGILNNFHSNYRLGNGDYMVMEGDEYDTAYFDKGPKFLHYDPLVTILTSIEFDHADIYRDLSHVVESFDRLLAGLSATSTLFAYDADDAIDGLLADRSCRIERYGKARPSHWRLDDISVEPPWTLFTVLKRGIHFDRYRTPFYGDHNLLNALSVISMADTLGIPKPVISDALETFQGIKRRQEIRGEKRGITVMDDFAHHPTAVRETLRAVRPFFPDGRVVAVFEPRTHASMRTVFQPIYPRSFDAADIVCVREPPMLHKVPPHERFSSKKLVEDLRERGKDAHYFPDTETIIDFLVEHAKPGDLILIMSNGGFDNIHERLLSAL